MEKVVIVRYSELGLKSEQVRRRMERALVEHLRRAVPGVKVSRERGRIFLHTSSREAVERASRVFGVASVSPAEVVGSEFEELLRSGLEFALPRVRGRSFALRVRRVGEHDYRSTDVARELGRRIQQACGARVELKQPEVEVFIEVRGDRAYLYDEVVRGVGGLPYATQGRVLALVSGGIDSPVAAWLMMRRGAEVSVLFMNPQPLVDERTESLKIGGGSRILGCDAAEDVHLPLRRNSAEASQSRGLPHGLRAVQAHDVQGGGEDCQA
ncbi:MAG: hypothetical protein GXN98_04465 [Euryarchaeota archaeon]|nr:hypothetical protein [Euryarchaeota archaeon]